MPRWLEKYPEIQEFVKSKIDKLMEKQQRKFNAKNPITEMTENFYQHVDEQVPVDEQVEKRELLLSFAEMEATGINNVRRFDMNSDLQEMRFWHQKLQRNDKVNQLREFEKRGHKLEVDLENATLFELKMEIGRLEKIQIKRTCLLLAFAGLGFIAKTVGNRETVCLKCNVVNQIDSFGASVQGIETKCLKCEKEKAEIYQPQCGHVCLCRNCFIENSKK